MQVVTHQFKAFGCDHGESVLADWCYEYRRGFTSRIRFVDAELAGVQSVALKISKLDARSLYSYISRWRWQPKGGCRRPPFGIPRRARGSHSFLKLKIAMNVTAMKHVHVQASLCAHPCATITQQFITFECDHGGVGMCWSIGVINIGS